MQQICAVCCGTKRLTEIQCPDDCGYLAVAREHPAATTARQQQLDVELLLQFVRDFSQRQSQLFAMTLTFLVRYQPPEFQSLTDDDVAESAGALAATFEAASSGAGRFNSGLRLADFTRTMSFVEYSRERMRQDAGPLERLARFEGLEGHARTARLRE